MTGTTTFAESLRATARDGQAEAAQQTAAARTSLPLRYLRQQGHLTAPASEPVLAEKALGSAHRVAERLLDRYGIGRDRLAERLGLDESSVDEVLAAPGAPLVLLDLEDGVAPGMVAQARDNAVRLLRETDRGATLCFVRPAGVEDPRCADDLIEILLRAGDGLRPDAYPLDGIVMPKARHAHEIEWLEGVLTAIEDELGLERNRIRVSLQIETGFGVLNLRELAAASRSRLAGIILGTVDLSADLLLQEVRYRHPVCEWARMAIVVVAGAMGVPAIDGMTLDFPIGSAERSVEENRTLVLDRMRANYDDALHSIDVGMSGRWTGHPLQLVATELAFRSSFSSARVDRLVADVERFGVAARDEKGATAGPQGELLDIGTDRQVRAQLRRAAAWGYLDMERAAGLGLVTDAESGAKR